MRRAVVAEGGGVRPELLSACGSAGAHGMINDHKVVASVAAKYRVVPSWCGRLTDPHGEHR